ncbi:MAG: hypothetical protein HY709_00950 [Candidatus Latescibacteria bacterium]|nr:hypothetical protein [Candidatus Latescibacterota bacterium]
MSYRLMAEGEGLTIPHSSGEGPAGRVVESASDRSELGSVVRIRNRGGGVWGIPHSTIRIPQSV